MLLLVINKVLMLLLCLSSLNVFRRVYYFIQSWVTSTEDNPVKYFLTKSELLILGISIAYILTVIFTGIKL